MSPKNNLGFVFSIRLVTISVHCLDFVTRASSSCFVLNLEDVLPVINGVKGKKGQETMFYTTRVRLSLYHEDAGTSFYKMIPICVVLLHL